ncbi:MAG TPA: imidazole glycerol phosphate synthase subunit HisH [Candidatus Atribacteria bacterium]|nr:imidazole glycerol phosphate synthase subunit HisH [Candidatus Atribacteria bacterium]
MIVIIDYGVGNVGSILNMLKKIKADAKISSDISDIEMADKLILPGVGSFDDAIKNIKAAGLLPTLNEKVIKNKTPILGICLGMQLFSEKSEEGSLPGLGWIKGETVRFKLLNKQKKLKIPHMGWNTIKVERDSTLLKGLYENARFYFVHSYHLKCYNEKDIVATTWHGYNFPSIVEKNNIVGVQFHPEKSHKFGMQILKNFVEDDIC